MKLANCTMHEQGNLLDVFRTLGYDVDPTPLLRQVSGAEDAYRAAVEAVEAAERAGAEGILLGGRTDICIYAAIEAAARGLQVFVAETRTGATPIKLKSFIDGYYGPAVYVDRPSSL